jgi:hypothetical protein
MTRVAILPVSTEAGGTVFSAVSGNKHSLGASAGAALDALTAQLSDEERSTLVIVQSGRSDPFFGAAQQQRLAELMASFHAAQEQGRQLPADQQSELNSLVERELQAAGERAAALARELAR